MNKLLLEQKKDDLTKLRQRVAELEAEEAKHARIVAEIRDAAGMFRHFVENAREGIWAIDDKAVTTFVNPRMAEILGYTAKEMLGKRLLSFIESHDVEPATRYLERHKRKAGKRQDFAFIRKDGTIVFTSLYTSPIINDMGEHAGVVAFVEDITERRWAEGALRRSEEYSATILNSSPNPIFVANPDTSIRYVNPAFEALTGFSLIELIGQKAPYSWWTEETLGKIKQGFKQAFKQGVVAREALFKKKNGERFWVEVTATPVIMDGEFRYYLSSWVDVTERKLAVEGLQRERDRAQHYLDIAGVMLVAINSEGNVTLINKRGCEILGYKEQEIIGKNWFQNFLPENVRKEVQTVFRKLVAGKMQPAEHYENPVLTKGGKVRLIAWENRALRDAAGNIIGTLSSGEDITERQSMLDKLREGEEKYRAIFAEAREGIVLVDEKAGRITDCNPEFERQTGRSLAQLTKMKVWELRPPEKIQEARQKFFEIREKGAGESERYELQKPNGKIVHIDFSVRAITVRGKRYLQSMVRDITERKKAEEALQLRARLLNEATDSIIATDLNGNLIYMNEATCQSLGYSVEKLLTMNLKQLVPPGTATLIDERLELVKTGETITFESERMRQDGRVFPVEIMARTIKLGEQAIILSVIRDITERKKTEEALRESEERYRALLELEERIGEAVVMLQDDERGIARHIYASEEWSRITGYSRGELFNMSMLDLLHPADHEEAIRRHKQRMRGEILPGLYEATIIRKDGNKTTIEGTYACSTYKGKPANVGYIRDISERRKMEEQLIVTDRLASIGELASGVAHELNNPLTGIIGFSELLLNKNVPADVKEDLKVINREAQRTSQVVRNLLTFARKHDTTKKPVNINQTIQSVLELRAYEQKVHNIEVVTKFDPSLPEITADIFRLQQVFVNIIINAEHFMMQAHGKGKLTITTELEEGIIRASFADDGPGIKEEDMRHLFDPFFTTKEVGKGTGLGLSICHGIVTEHGGNIYAESQLNKGATFIVELPVK